MRLVLAVVLLTSLNSSSRAQECVPADFDASQLVGRWDQIFCHDWFDASDCRVEATLYLRANGTYVASRFGEITTRGTWCITTEPRGDQWQTTGETLLEFGNEHGGFAPNYFRICDSPAECSIESNALGRVLTLSHAGIADFTQDTGWIYVGAPVSNDGTSWGAIKGMYR